MEGENPGAAGSGAVAFDMDMTLVESRRVLERLVSEHGYDLDVGMLMARYGLPMSQWLPEGCDHELFQALQLQDVTGAELMLGAAPPSRRRGTPATA